MLLNKLTQAQIKAIKNPIQLGDGGGLLLIASRSKFGHINIKWSYRFTLGKPRKMGLGAYPDVSLKEARDLATKYRALVRQKIDPVAHRDKEHQEKLEAIIARQHTFEYCATQYIESHKPEWKNSKHAQQWTNTLKTYAYPIIGNKSIDSLSIPMILNILQPIWLTKNETATRIRQRIENIIDWATVKKYRTGENPAKWKGNLDHLLAKPNKVKKVSHHKALAWKDAPAFFKKLQTKNAISALALQLTVLSAKRTGEVIPIITKELEDNNVWLIPEERMKSGKPHQEPLVEQSIALIEALKEQKIIDNDFLLPGLKKHTHLSTAAMRKFLQDEMGYTSLTVHGFRSTFRDWVAEATEFPSDLAETCLAHTLKNKTEAAYQRGDKLERRRVLMQAWADYLTS